MSNFMMNMISWILLLLVILTLYLIDKINHLAKMYEAPKPETSNMPGMSEFDAEIPGDLLFSGLKGKKLWDAMNGKQVEGFDATLIEALRQNTKRAGNAPEAADDAGPDGLGGPPGFEIVHVVSP